VVGKEILAKLCKEYADIISENPGVLPTPFLLLSREAMKKQEDGKPKLDNENKETRRCDGVIKLKQLRRE
jgi:hypothetical protein